MPIIRTLLPILFLTIFKVYVRDRWCAQCYPVFRIPIFAGESEVARGAGQIGRGQEKSQEDQEPGQCGCRNGRDREIGGGN